jgi:hypothetical protein
LFANVSQLFREYGSVMAEQWSELDPTARELLSEVWIAVGLPGYSGPSKAAREQLLGERFGEDGWRLSHVVRGRVVSKAEAIKEYEQSYRAYLTARPDLVAFLVSVAGNVYDHEVANVHDDSYDQPHTSANHYQDISVRRVIAEFVNDDAWPDVVATSTGDASLTDLGTGEVHVVPRASGMRGRYLIQVRDPLSPGYCLNPAVVPVHDPSLISSFPSRTEWYHAEGCAHLSVEAFWQMSKVVEVRYDRFIALGADRDHALDGL